MTVQKLRVAMTMDDLFMWPGVSFPEGSSPQEVARQLIDGYAQNGVKEVYAFSCTKPVEGTTTLSEVLDIWSAAGHHVGNHTHYHCALNWCSAEDYARDMNHSAALLRPWIDRAPTKYFRFAFDMWGDDKQKTDHILTELAKTGFNYAPISLWFSDTFFMFPHFRALAQRNAEVRLQVENLFVEQWMAQLKTQVEGARAAMGREVAHIALVHGTPLAGSTMGRICQRMREAGAEFISLEEAMEDPFNSIAPPLTQRHFRNFTQKWCEVTKTPLHNMPPKMLSELGSILPIPGQDEATMFGNIFKELGAGVNGKPVMNDFLE